MLQPRAAPRRVCLTPTAARRRPPPPTRPPTGQSHPRRPLGQLSPTECPRRPPTPPRARSGGRARARRGART
eukprot:scaffold66959_cov45-Phaeocystis_antarctica.AAC.1